MKPGSFDPFGPLFVPFFLLDEAGPVSVLIDPERVNWIGVNRLGRRLLERVVASPGIVGSALLDGEAGQASRFLANVHRRGFLANHAFTPRVRGNRRDVLEPGRLHEFWVVTNDDCNLRCRHCYTIDRVKEGRPGVPGEALQAILADARELGAELFYFTGGEPTLRPDFLELARFVLGRSKLILFTNGLTLTEELAAALSEYRERLVVQVSIEGPDEATNRPFRGKGAYASALDGVRMLLRHGIRVGVSSTPTRLSADRIAELTAQLAEMQQDGNRPDYHHLIMLLDRGAARNHDDMGAPSSDEFRQILKSSTAALKQARAASRDVRLALTNDKIFKALATNGPAKDYCGAGYTILGVSSGGKLLPCAACMDDEDYFLEDLLEGDGTYRAGTLREAWLRSAQVERIRRFSLSVGSGEPVRDLRYFHGGGCWKNMDQPEQEFATAHPFARFYEEQMLTAIRAAAVDGVEVSEETPSLYSFMHRGRIACAGGRKTVARDGEDLDQGYCICFA